MSHYTTMILACGPMDANMKVGELNAALEALEISTFSGHVEHCVGILTDDYLPSFWIVDAVNVMEWNNPDRVQLFIRSEDDEQFAPMKGVHPAAMPGLVLFRQGDEWTREIYPEPLPALVHEAERVFGTANRLTVRAVIAGRLGKLEELVAELRADELAALGIGAAT